MHLDIDLQVCVAEFHAESEVVVATRRTDSVYSVPGIIVPLMALAPGRGSPANLLQAGAIGDAKAASSDQRS